ncbi:methyltransferase [Kaistia dalseonensis]|uniref:tRNA1(Val) A37 N6-methylase TrmN6 n=1 Tax=Kaistia dalseonensis TaxID=410840 RepID=A0ABU0HCT6_9HYPH|nr:methyltransferase [Kaistia dalseonensis]MCX5497497.1 methyltransferase [Kaistia dalseonensis]MDQ0440136.1 tRNA1(Val) A37 N6-methylase TrmN6 [Kaistia dalseonensis]
MLATAEPTTIDAFLGGAVEAVQPAQGHHRSGLDAVLLAAGLGAGTRGRVVDLGAGAGVAGMTLAARAPLASVVLAEREPSLAACADAALARAANAAFAARVSVSIADILRDEARRSGGLLTGAFDHAIMNPPFHDGGSVRASPNDARARAHVLDESGLDGWFRAAAALVRPRGTLAVILPADRLGALLAACEGRFGGLALLPVHARPEEPALRVLARGVKGSRAPSRLLPGLVLHGAEGSAFLPGIASILRNGAAIGDIHPSWSDPAWGDAAPSTTTSQREPIS